VPRLMCKLTSSPAVNRTFGESNEVLTFWISITGHHLMGLPRGRQSLRS
jgi:hypothetical protein